MKPVFAPALLVICALAAVAGLAPAALAAGRPTAADPATSLNFAAPKKTSLDSTGTGHIAASSDGSANILANVGNSIELESNPSFDADFTQAPLDAPGRSYGVGNAVLHHAAGGRIWAEWFRDFGGGNAAIAYGLKDPGTGTSSWHTDLIPGSGTGTSTGGGFKVTDIQTLPGGNRVYALWSRNDVGARLAYSDDGVNWSAPDILPGPFSSTAAAFSLGVTSAGVVFVGWFERESGDLLVQMRGADGHWGAVSDIAPMAGQAYGARFAGDRDGGVRVIWDQVSNGERDVWYREWTPAGGWDSHLVQLFNTHGDTSGGAYDIRVDAAGVAHIIFSDDSAQQSDQQTFYMAGRGTTFTAPQLVVPAWGLASSRFPDLDVNTVNGAEVVHVVTNSNVGGHFANYYTYATLGPAITPIPTPPPVPTAGPTPCTAGQFSDVPQGSAFWPFIRDLVARGAISGYTDCTFRPASTVTRGQIAKVLVLALGLPVETPATATFRDVPVGSAFFPYIETAYAKGMISGYADGTFRPFANITRGQLTKIVTLGRVWFAITPLSATFRDVPTTNPFFSFIETAYAHGVVSGYPCGSGCLQFRPANTATRGQGAKVIDLAITAIDATPTPAPPSATPVPPTATATAVPTPTILRFSPASIEQYDTLTLVSMSGENLGAAPGTVTVNGVPATVDSWSPTLITFQIGAGTPPRTPTTVLVTTAGGATVSSTLFQVAQRIHPYIFSYTPPTVRQGDTTTAITMQGVQFGVITGTVTLGGTYPATIQSWTDTAIVFHIAADTPAFNPIYVQVTSPQNGSYLEYGLFGVVAPPPTAGPGRLRQP